MGQTPTTSQGGRATRGKLTAVNWAETHWNGVGPSHLIILFDRSPCEVDIGLSLAFLTASFSLLKPNLQPMSTRNRLHRIPSWCWVCTTAYIWCCWEGIMQFATIGREGEMVVTAVKGILFMLMVEPDMYTLIVWFREAHVTHYNRQTWPTWVNTTTGVTKETTSVRYAIYYAYGRHACTNCQDTSQRD